LRQILEVPERLAVAGDKIALAVLDIGKRAETIDFQFFCGLRSYVALVIALRKKRMWGPCSNTT
jgi:hypothetical protein